MRIIPTRSEFDLALLGATTPSKSEARRRRRDLERRSRDRARAFLEKSLESSSAVDRAFLKGLHLMIVGDAPKGDRGEYREKPVFVRWRGKVVYRAPAAELLNELMREFFDFVQTPDRSDRVEHSGRAMLLLLKVHPFREANGRTARAVATYLLLRGGYTESGSKTIEKFVDASLQEYYDCLAQSSIEHPERWDRYFSEAVSSAFRPPRSRNGSMAKAAERLRRMIGSYSG